MPRHPGSIQFLDLQGFDSAGHQPLQVRVEELLRRLEFADFWALKWADVLHVDRQPLGHKRAYAYYRWIRDSVAENKPLDQFARAGAVVAAWLVTSMVETSPSKPLIFVTLVREVTVVVPVAVPKLTTQPNAALPGISYLRKLNHVVLSNAAVACLRIVQISLTDA